MMKIRTHESNSGLTLVEVLVVLLIICAILGMLLPALHGSRERARETVCKNNLHQVSLAFAQLCALQKRVPNTPLAGYAGGWSVEILDFMEARSLCAAIGRDRPMNTVPKAAFERPLPMTCPTSIVTASSAPPIEAAHFILLIGSDRKGGQLSDAPMNTMHPWLSGPEYTWDEVLRLDGPHNRGYHRANWDGSVHLVMSNN